MKEYKETQAGVLLSILALLLILYLSLRSDFNVNPFGLNSYTAGVAILFGVIVVFNRMSITVTNREIRVSLGAGFVVETILLADIQSIEEVKNPWYAGWGIRLIRSAWGYGTLYCVQGRRAVEIRFKGTHDFIRIGTRNPGKLKQEITMRLPQPGL